MNEIIFPPFGSDDKEPAYGHGFSKTLFGTDGIRATANVHPVTVNTIVTLAQAAGKLFRRGDQPHRVVIGKDTRLSGYMLEAALMAGFTSAGMNVLLVGPMPTPAVAFLTRSLRADIGVMVSASHNRFQDNGVKLFGPDGFKLPKELETEIEQAMAMIDLQHLAAPAELGRAKLINDARGRYIESLKASFPKSLDLVGVRIVVDCANGAAYNIAPDLFWELGAEVLTLGTTPNGLNINEACGSTHPETLAERVRAERADLGIALDGDADRLVLCDEHGRVIHGDQVLALIATSWQASGRLRGDGIAATIMTNSGLATYLKGLGLHLYWTKVGDRYVVEKMRDRGLNIGGEQAGHTILTDFSTTGDGLLAALQVLAVLRQSNRSLSELSNFFTMTPQQLINIPINGSVDLNSEAIKLVVKTSQANLAGRGRLIIRRSSTEPVVRVMVEADDNVIVDKVINEICKVIRQTSISTPLHL